MLTPREAAADRGLPWLGGSGEGGEWAADEGGLSYPVRRGCLHTVRNNTITPQKGVW